MPGLFAAGDATTLRPSVANAVASGNTAAAMVVQSLIALQTPTATGCKVAG